MRQLVGFSCWCIAPVFFIDVNLISQCGFNNFFTGTTFSLTALGFVIRHHMVYFAQVITAMITIGAKTCNMCNLSLCFICIGFFMMGRWYILTYIEFSDCCSVLTNLSSWKRFPRITFVISILQYLTQCFLHEALFLQLLKVG